MLKKLLPVVLIVLAFNFLIYTIWEKPKTKDLPPTAQKTLEALSIPMVDDPLTALAPINGSDVHWVVSLKSGQIVGWQLAHYSHISNGKPLELLPRKPGFSSMGLYTKSSGTLIPLYPVAITLNGIPLSMTAQSISTGSALLEEKFMVNGNPVTLSFALPSTGYKATVAIKNPGKAPVVFGSGENFGLSQITQSYGTEFQGPIHSTEGKMEEVKKDGSFSFDHPLAWLGNEDKYFIGLFADTKGVSLSNIRRSGANSWIQLETLGDASFSVIGEPKRYSLLKAQNPSLIDTIDFGWFMFGRIMFISLIAKPLFLLMTYLHHVFHNYGVAIILVTIIIKLIFSPLAFMSYRSIHQMQTLQPEIKKLQNQYKDDKAALNQALMALYKERRVNPLGGCLPMLVQIPVFVALYNILNNTVELRQAPFILWIHDLSLKDPYYILPVLMGLTMILQYRLNPASPDPVQQKVMMVVPVIMTFFFLNFPSGLVLYWLVNNMLTILQQYLTTSYLKKQSA